MKKNYLLLSMLFFTAICIESIAQEIDIIDVDKIPQTKSVVLQNLHQPLANAQTIALPGHEDVIWDNGPLVNSPGTGVGGADESIVQTTLFGLHARGYLFQISRSYSLADDFLLDTTRDIYEIVVYGYQVHSGTTSTITEVQLRIYDGKPNDGGVLVWGDYSTNRLKSTSWSGIYRVSEGASGNTTSPIMECICDVGEQFSAGEYWLEVQMEGIGSLSGPWCPPVTINGVANTGNAIHCSSISSCNDINDTGHPQGMPFLIKGVSCHADIVANSDPGVCGAVVTYTQPDSWAAATVTQIDGTGLTSGDEFPVGVTTQSYQLVWDGGGGSTAVAEKSATVGLPPVQTDTCTFIVTVNDVEAPVVMCNDTVVYSAADECGAEINLLSGTTTGIAEEGITLPFNAGNGSPSGVAYNPNNKLYYAVRPGSSSYPLKTYDENGTELYSNNAGFDFRGLWWNPNTSKLEGNSYNGKGYRIVDLDLNGYALSLGINSPSSNYQPNVQSQGDYDFDSDEVIYYNQNRIYRTDRTTGTLLGDYVLSGLPSTSVNTTFVGYTGISEKEIMVYNFDTKEVYLIDKSTGVFSTSVQLPATAPAADYLKTSYANGYIWLYDSADTIRSYKITIDGIQIATDICGGIDSVIYSSGPFFPVGATEVTATAYDEAGNSAIGTFTVTVIDTIPPTIDIPSEIEISLDNLGHADSVVVDFIKALNSLFVDDNCSSAEVISVSGPATTRSFSLPDVNQLFDLSVEATDDNGNSTVVSTSIKIVNNIDSEAPNVVCNPIDIVLHEKGRYVLTKKDFKALSSGTTDNTTPYGELKIKAWPLAFGCRHVGDSVQVDVIVTDAHGNTSDCWVYCTVIDPHTITTDTIDNIEIDVAPGVCETKVTYPEITSSSPCAVIVQTAGLGPDGMFPIGTTTETWELSNSNGDTIFVSFDVIISTTNALPTFDALSDIVVDEDTSGVTVNLTGISYGNDCEAQEITVVAVGSNPALVHDLLVTYTSADSTATLDLSIMPNMSGTDTIEVVVADNKGGAVLETFVLTVNEVNDPPTIDVIADVTVDEDSPVVNVLLSGISSGPSESQDITVTAAGINAALVSGIVVNYTSADATGSLDLTVVPLMTGTDTITVTVSDGTDSVTETFVLTVVHVNHAPTVVNPVSDNSVNASYELTIELGDVFTDVDGDELTIEAVEEGEGSLPAWATIEEASIVCTPMIADTGCVMIVIIATDPDGAMAADTFEICVDGYPTAINDLDVNAIEISMYPNPTKGIVNVEFNSSDIYDVDLAVLDISGKLILRKQYSAEERISFDMSNQVSGMYFVKLGIDGKQIVKKLILDRK